MVVGAGNHACSDLEITMTNSSTSPATLNPPREHSKALRLLELLRTGRGASLDDMIEATGWQSHTVRAAMTGLRKRGFAIERKIEGTITVWSIGGPEA